MSWIWLFVLVLVVFVVLAALKGKTGGSGAIGFPYQLGKPLFSAAERSFLGVLDQAVGPEHRVFGKVRVADIAAVKSGLGNSARQGALNRIAAKHFDFVVCRSGDLSVICAVELNDKSHTSRKAQSRDELLANVCRAIGLPLLTVPAKAAYSLQDVRAQFLASVEPAPVGVRVGT
ncbi:DUF2726 domain-containing protein [Dokdonella sp.]|uniref:DUF2726 domain-containing protein n=1 Tax=Dokdonella sp. TaxID=2291710 RepID=UPI0025BE377C|nr:DUF2726 domain-containing protein [Dokdonella sp.]MBX3691574.1 DUF2726 domain-containing protein [Dokdonella sp.]MBX3691625.1 DUF2726 domain-containing protein [Dokdonella sp.]